MDSVSGFARAADVVIDVLREMLDELRGMRIEVTQSLSALRSDVSALQTEVAAIGKRVDDATSGTEPPRRPPTGGHGATSKRATGRRR